MTAKDKKQIKAEIKQQKKQLKMEKKLSETGNKPASGLVRFAEGIRGIIYMITGLSIIAAIILGQQGVIVTLDEIIENLLLAKVGKILLAVIAAALILYGFKNMRWLK